MVIGLDSAVFVLCAESVTSVLRGYVSLVVTVIGYVVRVGVSITAGQTNFLRATC